jgi:glutamate dehydrogenase
VQEGTGGDWVHAVARTLGGPDALERAGAFAARAPAGYADQTPPAEAARDLEELERLAGTVVPESPPPSWHRFGGRHRLAVRPATEGSDGSLHLRRYGTGGVELTGLLPVIESFGLVVIQAVPFRFAAGGGQPATQVDDFALRLAGVTAPGSRTFDHEVDGRRLVEALEAIAYGMSDVDSLNRLVAVAGLGWRQVVVLRAYRRYRRQAGTELTDAQLENPLVEFPEVCRDLLGYFEARFDPDLADRQAVAEKSRARVLEALVAVPLLEQDQALRGYLTLIEATLRTNYFARGADGQPAPTLTLKLDGVVVPDLTAPRLRIETFVHGATVEGIHLRAGPVARGGIRWSTRPEDLRTEVLGLARAQIKKNAVIVPTGAKGGFVCRRPGVVGPVEVRESYLTFVRGLLDVTDNIVAGRVIPPPGVVPHDGEDPYLVVAADKGTATFSDLANEVSAAYGYWLGDAFASGGSQGYDHKAMGITARGAWVAVQRHFRQLGVDVQTEPVRVVGVGDMSGDVFGNAMLLSRAIRLVAAFDHRHVFVDPDPDPEVSFAERARLAALERSSWDEYDRAALSPGGGVWARQTKEITLAPEARRALGVSSEVLSPPQLVSAILAAPVDLLWFGGIGTFVRHPEETDHEVGDPANDAVRVTADQVRARVIGEGANLGITQRGRIRYSRRGGRINTDFIDNAAGVATSDREVNLKILLALAIEEGRLDPARRAGVLAEVEPDVAAEVLRQVDRTAAALSRAVPASADELAAYGALLDLLERDGRVDRGAEALPDDEELAIRHGAGAGLIRPELAVLLAYAKSDLVDRIGGSDLVREPTLAQSVCAYFPAAVRERFGDLVVHHRLYPQLAATDLAGELVDRLGIVWTHETAAQLGRTLVEAAGAYWAARQVLAAEDLWAELEELAPTMPADAESALHGSLAAAVAALARSYLTRSGPVVPGTIIATDRGLVQRVLAAGRYEAPGATDTLDGLLAVGADVDLATRVVHRAALARIGDVGAVVRATAHDPEEVLSTFDAVDRVAALDRLTRGIRQHPTPDRLSDWQARALLDDVASWRRRAATVVLATPVAGQPVAEGAPPVARRAAVKAVLDAWRAEHEVPLRRAVQLIGAADQAHGSAAEWAATAFLALRALERALD